VMTAMFLRVCTVRWMNGHFGGREFENQPTFAYID